MYRILCIYLFLSLAAINTMGAELIKIRHGQQDAQKLRIVLDISEPVQWAVQDQIDPDRLTLSVAANIISTNVPKNSKIVKAIQLKDPLVLEFHQPITVQKAFSIPASRENPHYRVVIDVVQGVMPPPAPKPKPKAFSGASPMAMPKPVLAMEDLIPAPSKPMQKVIVIDAGHGGEDPGALGYNNTREKDLTFRMANILKTTLETNPLHKVILTRGADRSMRLRDRVRIARRSQGDIFISLHADSHSSSEAQGLSIYTLSHVASDRDAEKLALRENKADLIMGVELETESPEVANILIDLVKRETMNMSAKFAESLIKCLKNRIHLLRNTHRFADFGVLRSPDVPSVLIELGFLSNRQDEKLLNSKAYLQKIADGILQGIRLYFEESGRVQ